MLEEFGTNLPETVKCNECGRIVEKIRARKIDISDQLDGGPVKMNWICRNCLIRYFPLTGAASDPE